MKYIIISIIIILILALGLLLSGCAAFGTRPNSEEKKKFLNSPQYKADREVFDNRIPNLQDNVKKRIEFKDYFKIFSSEEGLVPKKKLPEVHPLTADFLKSSENIKVIWLGHSTVLLNLKGKIVLIDPVFSGSASPFSFMVKRFQPPVLKLEELPKIDYIVISHDHYDHLDMETMEFFSKKDVQFLVPLGVGSHLVGWDVDRQRITELDWWQSKSIDGLEFTATPAQHFSGRNLFNQNQTLWASWVIKNDTQKIYFSGDSGYDIHFKEIGDKLGPFDLAFVENGQYNPKWCEVHLLPDEVIKAYTDLNAKKLFPIHWGMFKLSFHPWYEPIQLTSKASAERGIHLVSPIMGEIVEVTDERKNIDWWKDYL